MKKIDILEKITQDTIESLEKEILENCTSDNVKQVKDVLSKYKKFMITVKNRNPNVNLIKNLSRIPAEAGCNYMSEDFMVMYETEKFAVDNFS